jgi:hypothetical protein
MSDLLGNVRSNPALLFPVDDREIVSFTVSLTRPMGLHRSTGKRSFIESVLHTLDDFYGDVVQYLREWQPTAPKLKRDDEEEEQSIGLSGGASPEPVVTVGAGAKVEAGKSSESGPESSRMGEAPGSHGEGSQSPDESVNPDVQSKVETGEEAI